MILITKEGAFKIFYYIIACDGTVAEEELEKLDEIGVQLFGDVYSEKRYSLIAECEAKTGSVIYGSEDALDILSEYIDDALKETTENTEDGIPFRLLMWNLLLVAHSDNNYDRTEKRLLNKINRRINLGESILFEMEQYISTVQTIDNELDRLKDSMEPYKFVRPVVDELENRRNTIKQAAIALLDDELLIPAEKISVQDDAIDKAQAAIREKTDPLMKKINEQREKVFSEAKKTAAPAAEEAGKRLGKAFMGFGSKLLGKQSHDNDGD